MIWTRSKYAILVVILGVILLVLFTCEARAQTTIEFKILSPGHSGRIQEVGQVRYYLLDEYLQLYAFDGELLKLRQDARDWKAIVEKLEFQLLVKDKIITTLEKDKDILTKRGLRLDKDLNKCEKNVLDCAGGSIWPYVVGVVGAAFGIAGATSYVLSK